MTVVVVVVRGQQREPAILQGSVVGCEAKSERMSTVHNGMNL